MEAIEMDYVDVVWGGMWEWSVIRVGGTIGQEVRDR